MQPPSLRGLGFARRISFSHWTWSFHQVFLQAKLHIAHYSRASKKQDMLLVGQLSFLSLHYLGGYQQPKPTQHNTEVSLMQTEPNPFLKHIHNHFVASCTRAACRRPTRHVQQRILSPLCLTLSLQHPPTFCLSPSNQQAKRLRKQNSFL